LKPGAANLKQKAANLKLRAANLQQFVTNLKQKASKLLTDLERPKRNPYAKTPNHRRFPHSDKAQTLIFSHRGHREHRVFLFF
jgi:hypothetical protein